MLRILYAVALFIGLVAAGTVIAILIVLSERPGPSEYGYQAGRQPDWVSIYRPMPEYMLKRAAPVEKRR